MITETSHYTALRLERLSAAAARFGRNEASIMREALDDVLKNALIDRLSSAVRGWAVEIAP